MVVSYVVNGINLGDVQLGRLGFVTLPQPPVFIYNRLNICVVNDTDLCLWPSLNWTADNRVVILLADVYRHIIESQICQSAGKSTQVVSRTF